MSRLEFAAKTKALRFHHAKGRCEECHIYLVTGRVEYDHAKTAKEGGDNSFENCRCLCITCHKLKTKDDVKRMAKTERQFRKHVGIKKPRTITRWRKMNGEVVIAERNR